MTHSDTVSTRQYQDGDRKQIVHLLKKVFGAWPPFDTDCSAEGHWDWKYRDCPGEIFAISVSEVNGRLVGCTHGSTLYLKIGGHETSVAMGGDHAVHRDYRKQGLSGALRQSISRMRRERGITCAYFETRHPHLRASFRKYCVMLPFDTRHLVKTKDVRRHLQEKGHAQAALKSLGFGLLAMLTRIRFQRMNERHTTALPTEIRHFDTRFDRFWEAVSADYQLIVVRDCRFLNWRYADPRAGCYRVRAIIENEEVQGYIVIRIDRSNADYPEGYLVDLLYRRPRRDVAATLVSEALEFLQSESVNAIHVMVPQAHPARKLLGQFGFVDTLERNVVFLNPLQPDKLPLEALKNIRGNEAWYAYGDIDSI